jgi:2-polyprenyl-3-methyl-5-hydroxy-6-metoxy-1,4-benzoquinol methylase
MTSHDDQHHSADRPTSSHPPTEAAHWDERYGSANQLWSGDPNSVLVEVASARAPGRVLDVGCGEGADAVWLATQGWGVTALDISGAETRRDAREGSGSIRFLGAFRAGGRGSDRSIL